MEPKPRPQAKPRMNPLMVTLIFAVVVFVLFTLFAGLWGEKLWFDSLDISQVFSIQFFTTIGLFLGTALLVGSVIALNMVIAYKLRVGNIRRGQSAILDRYAELLETRWAAMVAIPSVVIGLFAGVASIDKVLPFLAWVNATPFGVQDTRFGLDASFFVFSYPMLKFVISLTLEAMVFGTLAAAVVHFATGSFARAKGRTRLPASLAHISFNVGILLIIFGCQTLLDRYGLMVSNGTLFTGLHYTGDKATLTASLILAVISFLVGLLFIANAWLNRPKIALSAIALMIVSGLILSMIYPALIQAFDVRPEEPDKERPYIEAHVKSTRQAYDIDDVDIKDYAAVTQVSPGQLKQDAAALPGIRLMDPSVIPAAFEQFQQVRGYYSFSPKLDVDRYDLNGVRTDAIVAAREIDSNGIADRNWNNIHTVYTHGFGLVAAYGNKRQPGGEPEWIARNIPPVGALAEHEPRIYYGERSTEFAIVGRPEGSPAVELDTPGSAESGGEKTNVYGGKGGVPIGGMFNRFVYAMKFGDINLMLSDRVTPVSKIMFDRTPKARVEKAAPWLETDSDPYPIVAGGKIQWVVDAYTVSATYPNSQRVSLRQATTDTQTKVLGEQDDRPLNYIRNSVKAIVDAYDGSVTLYAWDEADPILQTYSKVFPGVVKPKSEIPAEVLSHLRYPTDLFKVQREILARYHMTDPYQFYSQSDLWQVPPDPAGGGANAPKEPAYYLSIKWPGDKTPVFSLTTVYTPNLRQNLASYMAVNADASSEDYGKIRILRMSDSQQIDGPGQTFNAINTNQLVAEKLRPFLNEGAADAQYGNLLTLPMGNGLMYVEPIYTKRPGSSGSYPILKFVVVRFGEHIGIGETLQEALDMVFGGDAGTDTGEKPQSGDPGKPGDNPVKPDKPTGKVDEPAVLAAIEKAKKAYAEADAALKSGDLGLYQKKNAEARAAIEQALKAAGR